VVVACVIIWCGVKVYDQLTSIFDFDVDKRCVRGAARYTLPIHLCATSRCPRALSIPCVVVRSMMGAE
jgi:hypothetical protein